MTDKSPQPTTLSESQVFRAAELIKARDGLRCFLDHCEAVRSDVPFELAVLHSEGDIIGTRVPIPREWISWVIIELASRAQREIDEMGVRDA
jgi:hypothetical protein